MFLKSSLTPLVAASGFVAFDGGGAVPLAPAPAVARARLVEPAVQVDAAPAVEPGLLQSATWQPASTSRVRVVEGTVLIAVCSYFAFGVGRVFGWV